jgi:hypothetical protein
LSWNHQSHEKVQSNFPLIKRRKHRAYGCHPPIIFHVTKANSNTLPQRVYYTPAV